MTFLQRVLDPPSYGFERDGKLYVPSTREIVREFFRHMNLFSSKKNWLPVLGWTATFSFAIPAGIYLFHFATLSNLWFIILGLFYSMVLMGSHGTFWLHRYCTHRAFKFSNSWVLMICRNLVIKVIPEEIYVISHHVHHRYSEKPGDPYNVFGGWLYCYLSDANHQSVRRDLSEKEYEQVCRLMDHTGVHLNTYAQYQRWGSLCHPAFTVAHYVLNWSFWYFAFYLLGGHAFATAIFGSAGVWAFGVRSFNYAGHGRGIDKRRDGIDFNKTDISVNQVWPGYVAGEWHNNHHLYPAGARSGFLPYQFDLPWIWIWTLAKVGGVSSYRDFKADFMKDHYLPWLAQHPKLEPLKTS
jgi:stearoyl-CoA desaturase (delta-9 desaturase)